MWRLAPAVVLALVCAASGSAARMASPAALALAARTLPAGSVHVGDVRTLRLTVSNSTAFPALFLDAGFRESVPAGWSLATGNCPSGQAIFPGQSCRLALRIAPRTTGNFSATVCVRSMGPLGEFQPPENHRTCAGVAASVSPRIAPATQSGTCAGAPQPSGFPNVWKGTYAVDPSTLPFGGVALGTCNYAYFEVRTPAGAQARILGCQSCSRGNKDTVAPVRCHQFGTEMRCWWKLMMRPTARMTFNYVRRFTTGPIGSRVRPGSVRTLSVIYQGV